MALHSTAITFTSKNLGASSGNVFLINAKESGANDANVCNSAYKTTDYWAQVGFYWNTEGDLNWDDTSVGCVPQVILSDYVAGDDYKFSITASTDVLS